MSGASETTRREFLRRSAILAGASGIAGALSDSIRRAAAIDPAPGSSYLDAEHVVILMQENRSFDHAFGTLRGVRGFNDPRAIELPNGNPVWVQTNDQGESFAPFRLDIKRTNATWMGTLPHSWTDQVDARNNGRYDRWLQTKASDDVAYARMPLTLGYYTRDDIPFYYELADAFTICDQHFCSSLTGTNANRLHLWTGTIRANPSPDSPALLLNSDIGYDEATASWTTFPERLEDHGVSWKVYQNELAIDTGLSPDEDAWLSNFGCNPLEYFAQYHVRLAKLHQARLGHLAATLPGEINSLSSSATKSSLTADERGQLARQCEEKRSLLAYVEKLRRQWRAEGFAKLSARAKSLHEKAFCTNVGEPHYRELAELQYRADGEERRVQFPKGDVLHQFRRDVERGELPAVSWLVPPERLSDHPCAAWYGQWYLAEAINILTSNPDVWKRTIFILTYDENDGYFDHIPPFVAPDPRRPETGRVSPGVNVNLEYVTREQELLRKPAEQARESSIGLGYRVPMIIASPWSRGGCVCSQVFDHTSPLQFLEKLLSHRTGRRLEEPNITSWRRTVCGDLTSAFKEFSADPLTKQSSLDRDRFVGQIHQAKFQPPPADFRRLDAEQIAELRKAPEKSALLPAQEPGVRPSAPLPYELAVDGALSADRRHFELSLRVSKGAFGERGAGAPFVAYAWLGDGYHVRNYAVAVGERVEDSWNLDAASAGRYRVALYGPNGFYREYRGDAADPSASIEFHERRRGNGVLSPHGAVEVVVANKSPTHGVVVTIEDASYNAAEIDRTLGPGDAASLLIDLSGSFGWYDLRIVASGSSHFERRFAGRVETGVWGYSDPAMGRTLSTT